MKKRKADSHFDFVIRNNILSKSKRSQSQIITTILLIVLVLAAIIIVWVVVNNLITESAEGIGTSALTTQLEIKEAKLWVTGGAKVTVKREPGKGEITSLKFIFYTEDGESVIIEETEKIPKEIETKIYDFDIDEHPELYNINKVSVVPMFGEKLGMEFSETKPNTNVAVSELVSWWKFDGNARDSAGGNHGTPNGGVDLNYDDAIKGKVASFDGVDDYVNLGSGGDLEMGTNDFTVMFWLKAPSSQSVNSVRVISKERCGAIDAGWGLYQNQQTGILRMCIANGISRVPWNANGIFFDDTWHHTAVVFDRTNNIARMYREGSPAGTQDISSITGSFSNTAIDLWIGGRSSGSSYFNGTIDDVMIFNQALTEEQINAVYNNQRK